MHKIFSLLILGLLLLNVQTVFAVDQTYYQKSFDDEITEEDFDFSNTSYYITDEQMEEAKKINEIEDQPDFETKIINSSHFSSGTATKTYIPINKVQ